MSDNTDTFDGITPDMIRAAEKRAAATAADRGDIAAEPEVDVETSVKARKQTTR